MLRSIQNAAHGLSRTTERFRLATLCQFYVTEILCDCRQMQLVVTGFGRVYWPRTVFRGCLTRHGETLLLIQLSICKESE